MTGGKTYLGAALALVLTAAAAQPAAAGTVQGKVTGRSGKGAVTVRAVALETGEVLAATRPRTSRFSLSLPTSGAVALLVARTPARGTGRVLRLGRIVKVTKRRRTGLKLPLQARKTRRSASKSARPGFVDVSYPAIWVQHFDTSRAAKDLGVLGKGIADMLITDLAGDPCPQKRTAVVEREKLAEALKELRLQRSAAVDRGTRVRSGRLIEHNATVSGAISSSGDSMTITATYTDLRTGAKRSTTVTGPRSSFFDLQSELGRKLREILCEPETAKIRFSSSGRLVWRMHSEIRRDPEFPEWLDIFDEQADLSWKDVPAMSALTLHSVEQSQPRIIYRGNGTQGFGGTVSTFTHTEAWERDDQGQPHRDRFSDERCSGTAPAWQEPAVQGMQNRAVIEGYSDGNTVEVRWRPAEHGYMGGARGRCERTSSSGGTTVQEDTQVGTRPFGTDDVQGGTYPVGEQAAGTGRATFTAAELRALAPGQSITRAASPLGPLPGTCFQSGSDPGETCAVTLDFSMTITATREAAG